MNRFSKIAIISVVAASVLGLSFGFSSSYSLSNPLEFAEFMKQESGYTSITVSGEDSIFIEPDSVVLMFGITHPPTKLQEAIDTYQENVESISDQIKGDLGDFENTSVSYLRADFDGDRYRFAPSPNIEDSYVAYMSFPIKVDMETYQAISEKIVDLGLQVDDIRISQIPVEVDSETIQNNESVAVGIAYDSAIPGCEISKECYLPSEIKVDPGTEVIWSNDDSAAHTVTSGTPDVGPDGIFDSALFMAGDTFSYDFNSPGSYPYFCMVHPWMEGVVKVDGDATTDEFKLEVSINVRLETRPDTMQNTLESYSQTIDDLAKLLEENGISESIPRSSININPTYHDRGTYNSYRTNSYWNVKTTMEDVAQVYDIVSKYGNVHNIYMSYSENVVDTIRQELTHNALEDAKLKVLEIIDPMELEIKGIKNIHVNQDLDTESHRDISYNGIVITMDDWNNFRDGNATVLVDVEFEVGPRN